MKRILAFVIMLAVIATFVSCTAANDLLTDQEPIQIGIHNYPPPINFGRGIAYSFPQIEIRNGVSQVDLRGYDLRQLSLDKRLDALLISDFDSVTKWPEQLPTGFDPELIMELGKDPGLGVRSLHERGITGKGVAIAIIDQSLLADHVEYKEQLRHYEEKHNVAPVAVMHGAAVASIAVGKTVGVAPEASLYYIAVTHADIKGDTVEMNFTYLAESLNRVIEINRLLPEGEKIRVVAMATGWSSHHIGYLAIEEAVKRAKAEGIFVVASCIRNIYSNKFYFDGLGRAPLADANDVTSFGPGSWWAESFYNGQRIYPVSEALLIPMDSRCVASPTGTSDFVYYTQGGWSWSIPYIAGLYALACQVKPDITPEEFWFTGLRTGETIRIERANQVYELSKIVNPVKMIEELNLGK